LNTPVENQRTPHAVNRLTGDFRQARPCRGCATRTPQSPKTVDQTGQNLYHETFQLVTRGSEEASTGTTLPLKQHQMPILKCHVVEGLQLQERLQFSRCRRSNRPGVKINRRATSQLRRTKQVRGAVGCWQKDAAWQTDAWCSVQRVIARQAGAHRVVVKGGVKQRGRLWSTPPQRGLAVIVSGKDLMARSLTRRLIAGTAPCLLPPGLTSPRPES